jgi:hypothetical protein
MARAFQQTNLQHGVYVDAEKGFIKKMNRCSEHGILLNELFQDAKRKNKDLIMRAINFSNAFRFRSTRLDHVDAEATQFPAMGQRNYQGHV